jgi:hypothetical protein
VTPPDDRGAPERPPCRVLLDAVLGALEVDGHVYGSRPCQTCRFVSGVAGRSFGCVAFAESRR